MQHYQIDKEISKGYSGQVYLATNTITNKKVAVKVIPVQGKHEIHDLRQIVTNIILSLVGHLEGKEES